MRKKQIQVLGEDIPQSRFPVMLGEVLQSNNLDIQRNILELCAMNQYSMVLRVGSDRQSGSHCRGLATL